jgi:hypothetical protein
METPILEKVSEIIDSGKFRKTRGSEVKLKSEINRFFSLYKRERTPAAAKNVYDAIVEAAEAGKGELARKFAIKFEKEVSGDYLDELGEDT